MLERDQIVITRVANGWELRPLYDDRGCYPIQNQERAVASDVTQLTGIIRNWAMLQLSVEGKAEKKK